MLQIQYLPTILHFYAHNQIEEKTDDIWRKLDNEILKQKNKKPNKKIKIKNKRKTQAYDDCSKRGYTFMLHDRCMPH